VCGGGSNGTGLSHRTRSATSCSGLGPRRRLGVNGPWTSPHPSWLRRGCRQVPPTGWVDARREIRQVLSESRSRPGRPDDAWIGVRTLTRSPDGSQRRWRKRQHTRGAAPPRSPPTPAFKHTIRIARTERPWYAGPLIRRSIRPATPRVVLGRVGRAAKRTDPI